MTKEGTDDAVYAATRRSRFARLQKMLRAGGWAIADQALISATNFATIVLLARALTSTAFGAFVLMYTGLFFANSIQSALITQPHQILGARLLGSDGSPGDYERYTTSAAVQQVFLAGAFAAIALIAGLVAWMSGWEGADLLFALAAAVAAWQLQEFVRRVFYTEGRQTAAFLNDVISYGGQLAGMALLWGTDSLTPVTALAVLAATSAAGTVVGTWQLRSRFARNPEVRADARKNWAFGKWLLGSALSMWTSGQLYPVITAALVSVAATGALRAVITVMGPTHILLRAMDTTLPPIASRTYADGGTRSLSSMVGTIYWVTAPLMLAYCLVVAIFSLPLLDFLYGGRYNSYSWLMPMLALVYALAYLYTPVWIALRAQLISEPMFYAHVVSSVVVFTFGIAAIYFFGILGAGIGLVVHGLILNIFVWRSFRTSMTTASGRPGTGDKGSRSLMGVLRGDL